MTLAAGDAPAVKSRLDRLMKTYGPAFLDSDPLGLVRRHPLGEDREAAAFFASALAFGNAKAVRASLGRVLGRLGARPAAALREFRIDENADLFEGIVHRWVGPRDLARFAHMTGAALREWGSLEAAFMPGYEPGAATLTAALACFRRRLLALDPGESSTKGCAASGTGEKNGFAYLLPDPSGGSACKRLHLFCKWVVRSGDGMDLGLWRAPRPSQLTIPLDTHIARIGGLLGLTDRRTPDLRMAEEITDSLRLINPADPVSYDFAISRLGILGHCPRRPDARLCAGCPLRDICRHWRGNAQKKKTAARKRTRPARRPGGRPTG
ncbi:MAG: TIGR02757 family protein [Acidimicrobiales bacterium]|jgi:uncharacterized protein (TIGR02757 family)|nr:TIGR02757 family protein [Acidimicrobiales bacterium]